MTARLVTREQLLSALHETGITASYYGPGLESVPHEELIKLREWADAIWAALEAEPAPVAKPTALDLLQEGMAFINSLGSSRNMDYRWWREKVERWLAATPTEWDTVLGGQPVHVLRLDATLPEGEPPFEGEGS